MKSVFQVFLVFFCSLKIRFKIIMQALSIVSVVPFSFCAAQELGEDLGDYQSQTQTSESVFSPKQEVVMNRVVDSSGQPPGPLAPAHCKYFNGLQSSSQNICSAHQKNYYVKTLSNNLSIETIDTDFSREMIFKDS